MKEEYELDDLVFYVAVITDKIAELKTHKETVDTDFITSFARVCEDYIEKLDEYKKEIVKAKSNAVINKIEKCLIMNDFNSILKVKNVYTRERYRIAATFMLHEYESQDKFEDCIKLKNLIELL